MLFSHTPEHPQMNQHKATRDMMMKLARAARQFQKSADGVVNGVWMNYRPVEEYVRKAREKNYRAMALH